MRATDDTVSAEALPSNDRRAWVVSVPRHLDDKDIGRGISETIAVVAQVLMEISLLPSKDANQRIEDAYKAGLAGKLTPNTTYDHAFSQLFPSDRFNAPARAKRAPIVLNPPPQPHEHPELAWRSSPGPTYAEESAEEFVRTRYRRTLEALRFTLPRLLATSAGQTLVSTLRREGWLDWRILSALTTVGMNWRISQTAPKCSGT